jgi:transcriptional regulator with XRE-family HTH domain
MSYAANIIGPRVRALRRQRNWTHQELATEMAQRGIFISEKTLERIESQKEFVGKREIFAFASALRVGIDHLIGPESYMSDSQTSEMLRLLKNNGEPN